MPSVVVLVEDVAVCGCYSSFCVDGGELVANGVGAALSDYSQLSSSVASG